MLLFNIIAILLFTSLKALFQYIPCYYSTFTHIFYAHCKNCFNASHVIIQLKMVLQYLRCLLCFNTSHVIIQRSLQFANKTSHFCFNTSYVIIQRSLQFANKTSHFCFNTSYVIIQPTKNRHSCILLISINHDLKPFLQHFTNHSIENQLFVRNHVFTPFDRLFQKITW